ncbi:hypothetical protein E2C01_027514 [Portunus trituberculatus]|uniref:Uncharacterized protein n=1 Tax=Portunus trituberculatus TaxID=210409 RepID=A0A5B7ELR2_PORTR|nr:hypothetical protein [Portunus trituberculatus]
MEEPLEDTWEAMDSSRSWCSVANTLRDSSSTRTFSLSSFSCNSLTCGFNRYISHEQLES